MDGEPKGPGATRRLELASGVLEALAATATEAAPEEACGLLVGVDGGQHPLVLEVPRLPNRAPDPRIGFELEPAAWAEREADARDRGLVVLGHWHSHPRSGARPSDEDRWFAMPGAWSLVVTPAGEWYAWYQADGR